MGLEVRPVEKDFFMGFPTLKQRNIGGFLLFSSAECSISKKIKIKWTQSRLPQFTSKHLTESDNKNSDFMGIKKYYTSISFTASLEKKQPAVLAGI